MAGKKIEPTHKHRNIIDDILDLGLLILMVAWYFTGIELDEKTLATVGAAGATARVSLRRILMRLWGGKLGIQDEESESDSEPEPESEDPTPSETPTDTDKTDPDPAPITGQ